VLPAEDSRFHRRTHFCCESALAHRCAARTGQRQKFPDNDGFNEWPKHSCERASGLARATQLSFARNTGLYLGESETLGLKAKLLSWLPW
jgi:hypothetical protein